MKRLFQILILTSLIVVSSCIISNPKPEDCEIINATIVKITKGSSYDLVFHESNGDFYYINRGLQNGLNLDVLNNTVLNKTVTLHLH